MKPVSWSPTLAIGGLMSSPSSSIERNLMLFQEQRRDALVRYAALIRQNCAQLHWLEAVLVGKDATFARIEENFAAEIFTCACAPRPLF